MLTALQGEGSTTASLCKSWSRYENPSELASVHFYLPDSSNMDLGILGFSIASFWRCDSIRNEEALYSQAFENRSACGIVFFLAAHCLPKFYFCMGWTNELQFRKKCILTHLCPAFCVVCKQWQVYHVVWVFLLTLTDKITPVKVLLSLRCELSYLGNWLHIKPSKELAMLKCVSNSFKCGSTKKVKLRAPFFPLPVPPPPMYFG